MLRVHTSDHWPKESVTCMLIAITAACWLPAATGQPGQAPPGTLYKGCFADISRAMVGGGKLLGDAALKSPNMTIEMCRDLANSKHYVYFGLQASTDCWLSNDSMTATSCGRVQNGCSDKCGGDPSQNCGAIFQNSIYRVNQMDPSGEPSELGCFADDCPLLRALPIKASEQWQSDSSPVECADLARRNGWTVFGLQNGGQCWMGGNLTRAIADGPVDAGNCTVENCSKDSSYPCGSAWVNAVYAMDSQPGLNITVPPPPSSSPSSPTDSSIVTPTGIWSAAQKAGIIIGIVGGMATIVGFVITIYWKHKRAAAKK